MGNKMVAIKQCTCCKITKSIKDFYKQKGTLDGKRSACKICIDKSNEKYRKLHPETIKRLKKQFYENNKDKVLKECKRYRSKHRSKYIAHCVNRKALKLRATPKWLTENQLKQIESYYYFSNLLSKDTNTKYSVDHIIPLKGKYVTGLHVPWNLQIMSLKENLSKGNRLNE
jgi:hypothetical protein